MDKVTQLDKQQTAPSSQAITGTKRKASPSAECPSKRAATQTCLEHPPAAAHCQVCQRPCWFCRVHNGTPDREVVDKIQSEYQEDGTPPQQSTEMTSTQTVGPSTTKRRRLNGRICIGPKHPGFVNSVLQPCDIWVEHQPRLNADLESVFGKQSDVASPGILLDFNQATLERITTGLALYEGCGDDENNLISKYAPWLLVNEPDQHPRGPVTIISFRKDKWKPYRPGPSLSTASHFYDWDVEPDVTYAVSINQFEFHERTCLKEPPLNGWLANPQATCPYLTIEYKCGAKTGKRIDAVHQNTAASIIWLYQRRAMREELALDLVDLRHYSIILMDSGFEVWEARCDGQAFHNQLLVTGNLKFVRDVKEYARWSNAIHTWGIGPNATSFQKDARELMKRGRADPSSTLNSQGKDTQATSSVAAKVSPAPEATVAPST